MDLSINPRPSERLLNISPSKPVELWGYNLQGALVAIYQLISGPDFDGRQFHFSYFSIFHKNSMIRNGSSAGFNMLKSSSSMYLSGRRIELLLLKLEVLSLKNISGHVASCSHMHTPACVTRRGVSGLQLHQYDQYSTSVPSSHSLHFKFY